MERLEIICRDRSLSISRDTALLSPYLSKHISGKWREEPFYTDYSSKTVGKYIDFLLSNKQCWEYELDDIMKFMGHSNPILNHLRKRKYLYRITKEIKNEIFNLKFYTEEYLSKLENYDSENICKLIDNLYNCSENETGCGFAVDSILNSPNCDFIIEILSIFYKVKL